MKDIPLKIAMLAWNDADGYANGENPGKVVVVPWPDERGLCNHLKVSMTAGACYSAWHEWTKTQRLCNLFIEAWFIVCRDGVSPRDMHDALMVIPEYRDTWNGETLFSHEAKEAKPAAVKIGTQP
jgi:hypothetical protein